MAGQRERRRQVEGDHQLFVPLAKTVGLQMAPTPDRVPDYDASYFVQPAKDTTIATDVADSSSWFTSHVFP